MLQSISLNKSIQKYFILSIRVKIEDEMLVNKYFSQEIELKNVPENLRILQYGKPDRKIYEISDSFYVNWPWR